MVTQKDVSLVFSLSAMLKPCFFSVYLVFLTLSVRLKQKVTTSDPLGSLPFPIQFPGALSSLRSFFNDDCFNTHSVLVYHKLFPLLESFLLWV